MRSFKRQVLWIETQSASKGVSTNHAVSIARVSQDV